MFNGVMASSKNSYSNTVLASSISSMYLRNGIYDYIHIVSGYDVSDPIPTEWKANTIIFADFQNTLSAGNTDIQISDVSAIRIKRKESQDLNNQYITLFEVKVIEPDDMAITLIDNYAKANTEYSYAVCPVMGNGTEGAVSETTVRSDFCGIVICDKSHLYYTELEPDYSFDKNSNISTVTTLANRYPYVIHNDIVDYWSGSVSGIWLGRVGCEYDLNNQFKFRKNFYDWLNNGEAKILKFDDGREWLICITGGIREQADGHWLKVKTSFDWTEIGDCDNANDLFKCGLINKNPDSYLPE